MKCARCGLCREKCPVYLAVLKETASPRAKGILKNEELKSKMFFLCTLCEGHLKNCNVNSESEILAMREAMVKAGIKIGKNEEIVEHLKKYGHPFTDIK